MQSEAERDKCTHLSLSSSVFDPINSETVGLQSNRKVAEEEQEWEREQEEEIEQERPR